MSTTVARAMLLHIPLIHAMALIVSKARLGEMSPRLFANPTRNDWWLSYL